MPIAAYPGLSIPKGKVIKDQPIVSIPDVVGSFDSIPLSGVYIPIASDANLKAANTYNPYSVRKDVFQKDMKRKRHFQGIIRTKDGKHIILAGGDHLSKTAQLFICSLDSVRPNNRKAEIGLAYVQKDEGYGALEELYVVEYGEYWHNGGISICGDILVLALEKVGSNKKNGLSDSIIRFVDISNPRKPQRLDLSIKRSGTNAAAASMIRLSNKRYLCAVWTDRDPTHKRVLDLYLSVSTKLSDGFSKNPKRIFYEDAIKNVRPCYQVIQLILEDSNKVYMVGAHNSYAWAPVPSWKGNNRARLYRIDFDGDITDPSFAMEGPCLTILRSTHDKVFKGGGKRYNFNAAVGIYITPEKQLALYAGHHRTNHGGDTVSCTEFYPAFTHQLKTRRDSVIELYEHKNMKGVCLRLHGYNETSIPDYKQIRVEDERFNDKISSIRFKMPVGLTYTLYKDKNYKKPAVTLVGTGKMVTIKDIEKNRKVTTKAYIIEPKMEDAISSSKFT